MHIRRLRAAGHVNVMWACRSENAKLHSNASGHYLKIFFVVQKNFFNAVVTPRAQISLSAFENICFQSFFIILGRFPEHAR